jgi:hypothetical protein
MNIRNLNNATAASDERGDIVDIWRAAVLGAAAQRRAFLRRIMPGDNMVAQPEVIEFAARAPRKQPARAA